MTRLLLLLPFLLAPAALGQGLGQAPALPPPVPLGAAPPRPAPAPAAPAATPSAPPSATAERPRARPAAPAPARPAAPRPAPSATAGAPAAAPAGAAARAPAAGGAARPRAAAPPAGQTAANPANRRRPAAAAAAAGAVAAGVAAGAAAPVAPAQPAAPPEPQPTVGSVTSLPLPRFAALRAEEVNLRAGPGTRYPIEWTYQRRDLPVEIVREFELWRRIRDMEGTEGWVHQSNLTGRRTFVVMGEERVLRRRPEDGANVVARLRPGVLGRIRLCEAGQAWCEVQVGEHRGWLRRAQFFGAMPEEEVK